MPQSWMPKLAGWLNIIAGAIGIFGGLLVIVLFSFVTNPQDIATMENFNFNSPGARALLILYFVINLIAIAGGVVATKRKFWGLALTGAICAILSLWGWVLGMASIVFLTLAKQEFRAAPDDH